MLDPEVSFPLKKESSKSDCIKWNQIVLFQLTSTAYVGLKLDNTVLVSTIVRISPLWYASSPGLGFLWSLLATHCVPAAQLICRSRGIINNRGVNSFKGWVHCVFHKFPGAHINTETSFACCNHPSFSRWALKDLSNYKWWDSKFRVLLFLFSTFFKSWSEAYTRFQINWVSHIMLISSTFIVFSIIYPHCVSLLSYYGSIVTKRGTLALKCHIERHWLYFSFGQLKFHINFKYTFKIFFTQKEGWILSPITF